jgi:hypothetical protein
MVFGAIVFSHLVDVLCADFTVFIAGENEEESISTICFLVSITLFFSWLSC